MGCAESALAPTITLPLSPSLRGAEREPSIGSRRRFGQPLPVPSDSRAVGCGGRTLVGPLRPPDSYSIATGFHNTHYRKSEILPGAPRQHPGAGIPHAKRPGRGCPCHGQANRERTAPCGRAIALRNASHSSELPGALHRSRPTQARRHRTADRRPAPCTLPGQRQRVAPYHRPTN